VGIKKKGGLPLTFPKIPTSYCQDWLLGYPSLKLRVPYTVAIRTFSEGWLLGQDSNPPAGGPPALPVELPRSVRREKALKPCSSLRTF